MKILFVADLHYSLRQYDWLVAQAANYAGVIIGGDLLDLSSALDMDLQALVVGKYLARMASRTRLLVVSGNHDGDGRDAANGSRAAWLQKIRTKHLFVDGDGVEMAGALITLCPWWDGPASQAEVERILVRDAARRKGRWIWVHHVPPQGARVSWTGRRFAGDECLVEWIRRFQPDLVLSGHVHNAPFYPDGSWIDHIGKTAVFNPGRQLGPRPTCLSLDLQAGAVEWVSIEAEGAWSLDSGPKSGSASVASGA